MTPHAAVILERFAALDRLLQSKGWPPTSPWWHDTIARLYGSGRRQLAARVGRRGGKSSTLCRLAVVEGLWGGHKVPPGDVGVVAFLSTVRDEAAQRLRTIKAILDALGVKHRPCEGGVELVEQPVAFKVFTASVAGVSGFTCITAICDEVSKWRDIDSGANPASEVLASLRPTMATQPEARIVLSSSPLGTMDAHYDAIEQGDTPFQVVAIGATWLANPTITEEATRALEPDDAVWRREYAAIPQAEAESSLMTAYEVDAVTRKAPLELGPEAGVTYECAIDPAFRADAFACAVAGMRMVDGVVRRSVVLVREWKGSRAAPLEPRAVLREIGNVIRPYKVDTIWTDQASGDALVSIAYGLGLVLVVEPTTAVNKMALYENLKTRIADKEVELPPDPQVRADLLAVRKRITRTGISIELPRVGGRHCDLAPAIATVIKKTIVEPEVAVQMTAARREEERRDARRRAFLEKEEQSWWKRPATDRGPLAGWRR